MQARRVANALRDDGDDGIVLAFDDLSDAQNRQLSHPLPVMRAQGGGLFTGVFQGHVRGAGLFF